MIRQHFKIYEGEGTKVLLFALLAAILQAGVAIGISVADTLFLINVGQEKLPLVYIFMPVVMLFLTPAFSYLTRKLGIDRLVDMILGLLIVCGLVFFLMLHDNQNPASVYRVSYAVKFYASLWLIYLYTLFWNFADGYFDILDAKRLFSFFSGGMSVGAILGGSIVALSVHVLKVEQLFIIWSVLALLTFPLVYHVRRRYARLGGEEEEDRNSFPEQMKRLVAICRNSRYVITFVLLSFSMLFLTTLCEFLYLGIFSDFDKPAALWSGIEDNPVAGLLKKPENAQELAALFGKLFAAVNLFNVVVTLFFFSRIVAFLGVRNVALIQPLLYLATFVFFAINNGYEAALFGFLAYQGIQTALDFNNSNLVLNAVPAEIKKEIRTFTEGLFEPLAVSLAGFFLLIGSSWQLTQQSISTIGVWGAVLAIALVVALRRDYIGAMMLNLKKGWLDFSRTEESLLERLTERDLERLSAVIEQGDLKSACSGFRMLLANDRSQALKALLKRLLRASKEESKMFEPLVAEALAGEDDEAVRVLLQWLADGETVAGPGLIEELGSHGLISLRNLSRLSASPTSEARAAAAVVLWNGWKPENTLQAMEIVDGLLKDDEATIAAIRVLGKMGQERFSQLLATYLSSSRIEIRLAALTSIHQLADRHSSRLLSPVLQSIERGDSAERVVGMNTLARIADSRCIIPLLFRSESFTHFERRKATQVILGIGSKSVPAIVSVFRNPQYPYAARSIAARCLGNLLFPQLEALSPEIIRMEIERAYRFLYYHRVLEQTCPGSTCSPGIFVLSRFYQDFQWRIIEFVLEVLAIGGRLPDYEMINASLHSSNRKMRGNAIETIEQACPRQVFKLLLPLLERRGLERKVELYRSLSCAGISPEELLVRGLQSPFAFECAAAAQARYEIFGVESFALLRERMLQSRGGLLVDTAFSLFAREGMEIGPDVGTTERLNAVEQVYYLSRTPLCESFGILELEAMARASTEVCHAAGERVYRAGQPADELFLILAGAVRLQGAGGTAVRQTGETFGEACLFGTGLRTEDAVADPLKVLTLPRKGMLKAVEIHPRLGLALLGHKQALGRQSEMAR